VSELPTEWTWTNIGEISERIHYGYTASSTVVPTGTKLLRITDIQNNWVKWELVPYCMISEEDEQKYLLKKGDLVFARTGATVGKSFLIQDDIPRAVFASYLIRIILPNDIHREFVYYFFQSHSYWKQISEDQIGSGQPNVNASILSQLNIPLPPLNEQRRIVAKLEKLLAKCEASKQRLDKIPGILKRFRQSILAAACSGRLTADWRAQNPDVEPASELLKRIREKRQKSHEKKCEKAKEKGARKPKEPFEDYSTIKLENREELPLSWCITLFGNLTETQGGIQKTSKRTPGDNPYPYLRVANVYRGYLKLNEIEYFELFENDLATWKLEKNDLLIVEGNGSPTEIGRCAIWDGSIEDCVHQNHIIRSRPLSGIEASFLLTYLNSPQGMEVMTQLASSTSGLHTLSVSKVNNIIVPLAPIEEQKEIVQRVGKLFKLADQIEQRYQKARVYVDQLPQSILAKAFRGELVPQDPTDEPASVLLERIRAERSEQQNKASIGSKGRKRKQS
jgi:type I restriction enzyme, S subunit